jgi:hypothetical protein
MDVVARHVANFEQVFFKFCEKGNRTRYVVATFSFIRWQLGFFDSLVNVQRVLRIWTDLVGDLIEALIKALRKRLKVL